MIYHLLYPLHTEYVFLNVFRYITFRTIYAVLTALVISFLLGPAVIRWLQRLHIGQQIREAGPKSHQAKSGTPTMGGLLILIAVVGSTLLWADLSKRYVWVVLLATVGFGFIGFWDDYLKVVKRHSRGLIPRYKFSLQVAVAAVAAAVLATGPGFSTQIALPFVKTVTVDLGWLYFVLVVLVVVGSSNAVNLTDGLDGLAIGPVIVAATAYMIVAYAAGHRKIADYLLISYIEGAGELSVFCGAMIGASLGFLWFNTYPATVFMGDVGSLPLGAALGLAPVTAVAVTHAAIAEKMRTELEVSGSALVAAGLKG